MLPINIWCMFFASLVSIRLHPRNVESLGEYDEEPNEEVKKEILMCAHLADVMCRLAENRVEGRENCKQ